MENPPGPPASARKARPLAGLRTAEEATVLAQAVYRLTDAMPPAERRTLGDQMRRAAVSVYANIAEGHGRRSGPDAARFYDIAWASLLELEAHAGFARAVGLAAPAHADAVAQHARWTGRLLTALRTAQRPRPTRAP